MTQNTPQVLAKTQDWLVLNKPAGWLSIRGRAEVPVLSDWAYENHGRIWIVHRLDLETSGVILFARNPEAHRRANDFFAERRVKKSYAALVAGSPAPMLRLNSPIEGKSSLTQVEVKEKFPNASLISAFPQTGRRHQIRIHLSKAGFPLLGDRSYGGPVSVSGIQIPRVALHAQSLALPEGEKWEAPRPLDFEQWMNELRQSP